MIVFDDMIADMLSSKKLNPTETELFIRGSILKNNILFILLLYQIILYVLERVL